MLKQNKNSNFWLKSGIFAVLAFGIALSTMPFQADATWTGDCTWSVNEGTDLLVDTGDTCTITGTSSATSLIVNPGGELEIGDQAGTGADFTVDGANIIIEGIVTIDSDSSLDHLGSDFLIVRNGGQLKVDGQLDASGETQIFGDTSDIINNGVFNTYRLLVGDHLTLTDGGVLTNNGVVEVTYSSGGTGLDSIYLYEGTIENLNTDLGSASFIFDARMWMFGTATESSVFRNLGLVDAGEDATYIMEYSTLDLDGGRFVQYSSGCAPGNPSNGNIYIRSNTGSASDSVIDIANGALLSADDLEFGWSGDSTEGELINNGTIQKTDLTGTDLNCPIDLWLDEDSEGVNNSGGLIDINSGGLRLSGNNTFTNQAGAQIIGVAGGDFRIIDEDAVFEHYGDIDGVGGIELEGTTAAGGPIFNAYNGSTMSIDNIRTGKSTSSAGGTLNVNSGAEIIATTAVSAQAHGVVNADGHIEAAVGFVIYGGNTGGSPQLNLRDTTQPYIAGGILMDQGIATNTLTIDSGVELQLNNPIDVGGGNYYSISLGIGAGTAENRLVVDGTLTVLDSPVEPNSYVGGTADGTIIIGSDGFLDYNEQGEFVISSLAPYGLIDNSDDPLNEGVDIESRCLFQGNGEINNRLDCEEFGMETNGEIDMDAGAVINTIDASFDGITTPFQINGEFNVDNILQILSSEVNNFGTLTLGGTGTTSQISNGNLRNYSTLNINDTQLNIHDGSELFNEVGSSIIGSSNESKLKVTHDSGTILNNGSIDIQFIEVTGHTDVGGAFTTTSGTVVNLESMAAGNRTLSVGGNILVEAGAQVNLTDVLFAESAGAITADGQIDGARVINAFGGDVSGGGTIQLNDTSDTYEFGALGTNDTPLGFVSEIIIGDGAVVELNEPIDIGGGNFRYGGIGTTPGSLGDEVLTINGTLKMNDDPANAVGFAIGNEGNAKVNVGLNGLLDFDDEDGALFVGAQAPNGLFDNSDDYATEGIDVEGQCLFDGRVESNNRIDCVDLIHIQDDGAIDVGLDGVVTVEGSDTIVDGDIELDGTWNAGNLTVNNGGHITSGDDPTYTDSNFLLNVEDLIVNTGGRIASDGVSSRTGIIPGPGAGSYGGAGKGRTAASVYGQVKMDETFIPLYGESGFDGGVAQGNGGGAVRIHSTGNITIDGVISANGTVAVDPGQQGGAGGTVILIHEPTEPDAEFKGNGLITASGDGSTIDAGANPGSGGRISMSSPLFEYTDAASYDFTGAIEASGGENTASAPAEYAAAGTMYFGGDAHNPNGTLLVHQSNKVPDVEFTRIPNVGDNSFDKIEVLGQGNIDFEVDPAAPTVCYQTEGVVNFPTALDCDDYKWPDKPSTMFINTSAIGAQDDSDLFQEPGYQTEDGVGEEGVPVGDLTPVFSFVHTNPSDPGAVINQIEIEVDDDPDFSSPLWSELMTNLTEADGSDIVDGSRTEDIEYAGPQLTEGQEYYIRSRFVNAPGLWSHADYNNQWKFTAFAAPQPQQPGGGQNNNGPGGGTNPLLFPPDEEPEEEPEEESEEGQEEEQPAEEQPAEEQPAEEQHEAAPGQEPSEGQPSGDQQPESETQKVPRKPKPSAEEEPEQAEEAAEPVQEYSVACSRAGVTKRIIDEFNLEEIYAGKDTKCLENWEHCMLPFLIHSNYDATADSYFPDLYPEDIVGDSNPLPPVRPVAEEDLMVMPEEILGDSNPLPPVRPTAEEDLMVMPEDIVGDSNPLPPVRPAAEILTQDVINAVEFGTRLGMVQGYYEEADSPFRPYEIMNRIEIIKLLNFVVGFDWKYYEEYIAELGGEDKLEMLDAKAADVEEWWHVRYYNFACESGLLPCDPFYEFQPTSECNDEWLNETIAKYKKYFDDRDLDELQNIDSDNDTITNIDEEKIFFTNPQTEDTDADSLNDNDELFVHKTNPLLIDTDFDSLSDGDEINIHMTSPTNPDTDGDGAIDSVELENGTDPTDPLSTPDIEAWAEVFGIELENGSQDSDMDGLADRLEFKYGTDPLEKDTDGDGLSDGDEVLLYKTDPLTATDLEDLGALITNIQNGMILTDVRPLIQGIAPGAEMETLLILRNEFGHELQIGKTISDEKNAFVLKPEFDLRDGEFYLFVKALDPDAEKVYNSPMVQVKVDSSLVVESPKPERLADKLITDDILLGDLKVEIGSKMPTLSGKTGYKNQVVATWQSALGVSSIVADISAGEFHITAPIELPYGAHSVNAYAIRESDQAMSKVIGVEFDVKETQAQVISFEPKQEDTSYILYIVLGVIAVIVIGLIIYLRSRKKPTNPTDDEQNVTQN